MREIQAQKLDTNDTYLLRSVSNPSSVCHHPAHHLGLYCIFTLLKDKDPYHSVKCCTATTHLISPLVLHVNKVYNTALILTIQHCFELPRHFMLFIEYDIFIDVKNQSKAQIAHWLALTLSGLFPLGDAAWLLSLLSFKRLNPGRRKSWKIMIKSTNHHRIVAIL